ncbi:Protein KTI12, partial [Tetrabaena socialis]
MPLVVLCGQPCSGKSTIGAKLASLFQETALPAELVDEPTLNLERNAAYSSVVNEKNTRGKLRSHIERVIGRKRVTILDSVNNIKGYRYELWCVARAAGTRYCLVHVDTDTQVCAAWNSSRPEGERYRQEIFDDLAGRFERPDAKNRWDAPLFTVHPAGGSEDSEGGEGVDDVLAAIVRAMTEEQANTQTRVAKDLTPTMATTTAALSATNTLQEIDQAAQDVVNAIIEAQAAAMCGAASLVRFACAPAGTTGASGTGTTSSTPPLELELRRHVTLAELRRHKRSFLKLATKITFARLHDAAAARRMFVDYL